MLDAEFRAATMTFLDALSAFDNFAAEIELLYGDLGVNIEQLSLWAYPDAQAARLAYIAAFSASLAEINTLQAEGLAFYAPAYLVETQQFVAEVSTNDFTNADAAALIGRVNDYGTLYNDGLWANYSVWLRQRQIGAFRARYLATFPVTAPGANKIREMRTLVSGKTLTWRMHRVRFDISFSADGTGVLGLPQGKPFGFLAEIGNHPGDAFHWTATAETIGIRFDDGPLVQVPLPFSLKFVEDGFRLETPVLPYSSGIRYSIFEGAGTSDEP